MQGDGGRLSWESWKSIGKHRQAGQSAGEALYERYTAYGPNPLVESDDPAVKKPAFWARAYAREACVRLAEDAGPEGR